MPPVVRVLDVEVPTQELVRRARRAELATARRIWVLEVPTPGRDVALHEVATRLPARRIDRDVFDGGTLDLGVADGFGRRALGLKSGWRGKGETDPGQAES